MILRDSNEMRDTIYLISKITMKQEINPLTGRFDLVNDKTGFHTVKVSQLPETWEEGVMYVVEYDEYTTTYVWSNWEYIETGSTAPVNQVQSDWEQTDDTQVDYIKNKPMAYTAWTGIAIKNWPDYSAMQWPAPTWYHIPTKDEQVALVTAMTVLWIDTSNLKCMKTYMKMPFAGYRSYVSSSASNQGNVGHYWSANAYGSDAAYFLDFISSALDHLGWTYRTGCFSLRCFKDTPVTPDSNWTILFDWSSIAANAWIFHNTTDWLISISSDWINWITIQDKNLWATTVYNDWDTLSQANCGNYYQRWNNYGFPWTWSVTTSSTQVDASVYWPLNYYSSSTFITWSIDWSSVQNDNLWWWVTWVVQRNNAIINTWVISVNGKAWDIIITQKQSDWNQSDNTQVDYIKNKPTISNEAFKPFPNTFNTTWTTEQFLNSISSQNLPVGSAYLGQVSLSDMPDGVDIQWDVIVYVYPQNVIYAVMRSAEVAPYIWETNSYQYRGREAR